MNQIPGMNALGGLHDSWGRYDGLYDKWFGTATIINAGLSAGVVYGSFYTDYQHAF